ncbi:hypothetical protein TRVL_09640 [Trypanosoma vivax]|nr:hypothetical protein TRVL_09640 [Trypanosoma vivax]
MRHCQTLHCGVSHHADNTTQHNTTQHNTTQHNTTQHNTTQHNTTHTHTHTGALPLATSQQKKNVTLSCTCPHVQPLTQARCAAGTPQQRQSQARHHRTGLTYTKKATTTKGHNKHTSTHSINGSNKHAHSHSNSTATIGKEKQIPRRCGECRGMSE